MPLAKWSDRSARESLRSRHQSGVRADCQDLVAQLDDACAARRREAARFLISCPHASRLLAARLARETDSAVRAVITSSLVQIADEVAVRTLTDQLRSADATIRNEAVAALQMLPGGVAMDSVRVLLADPDPAVRMSGVTVLGGVRHPDVEACLIGVLAEDPDVNVCGAAADVLVEVGTRRARDAFIELQRRFPEEPYIQFVSDLALRRIEGKPVDEPD
jgi:HEAT repeat protein